ncbi:MULTISPECIES: DUF6932 family protein [unclassified Rhizobium]|uniref:DUF6932 family protein n=1 Tax=unclassified Rhizobium TaxID=2613769 RepID=UPI0007F154BC|nr:MULTISPECIES: hypothetical protein [unclassified Rhizobium]ANK84173.1 hypothetical protein AMK02_CH00528 [Rhizobium sp. N731]ANL14421.1 hypothetical protein AMJ97_CH00528 [Rhizobium sp. N1314]
MPIPDFDARGLIPPVDMQNPAGPERSPYFATTVELVHRFGTTPHRRALIRNLITYRQLLAQDGYDTGVQFIDGSFVENVELIGNREPGDIDVFSLVRVPEKYLADFTLWENHGAAYWMNEIINRALNKGRFSLDTFAIIVDDQVPIFDAMGDIMYWYGLFSHQRETLHWKGFVALDVNAADDAAALELLEGL